MQESNPKKTNSIPENPLDKLKITRTTKMLPKYYE